MVVEVIVTGSRPCSCSRNSCDRRRNGLKYTSGGSSCGGGSSNSMVVVVVVVVGV